MCVDFDDKEWMDASPRMTLREYSWIMDNRERCDKCNHLKIFHTDHCCSFCFIPECRCNSC